MSPSKLLAAFTASIAAGGLYGGSIYLIEIVLAPLNLWQAHPLDGIYASGFAVIFLIWLAMNMKAAMRLHNSTMWKRLYVAALNGSQPHPATITATRNAYQY
jgi:NAD(P)H-quinone oxidoreductase subunit 5